MYDSFLYGYGLTLFVFDQISNLVSESNPCKPFMNIDNFWANFLNAEKHNRILSDFNKYFDLNDKTNYEHKITRDFLKAGLSEIQELGFERWVSKNLFDKDKRIPKGAQFYMYSLYNYWYNMLHQNILNKPSIGFKIDKIAAQICNQLSTQNKIFTTNYDELLDITLRPKHIHGRFIIPLVDLNQIMMSHLTEKEFEYTYLFGTSGIEKLSRLNVIKNLTQTYYDLDFFYDSDLYFDHLLIFGLSLGRAEMISDSFLSEYPNNSNLYLAKSVDGHILLNLQKMYDDKRLNKITISYYSKDELKYYQDLFELTNYSSIVDYINSADVFIN